MQGRWNKAETRGGDRLNVTALSLSYLVTDKGPAHPHRAFDFEFVTLFTTFQFQNKDEIKAARIEATKAYNTYVEELKTSQRR
jgi:hypothetical protein